MDSNLVEIEQVNEKKLWIRNYSLSILFHFVLLVGFLLIYKWQGEQPRTNSIMFSLDTREFTRESVNEETVESINQNNEELIEQPTEIVEETQSVSFSNITADSTNLEQLYSEPTLNIKINYPKGWTFLDQNKNKKLEGVTFWVNDGSIIPPPYLHLEVISKDMFIEKRYKYKTDFGKYLAYYNDPEELQDYFTRVIYIRTEDDNDFQLKLMMKGENDYFSFEPKFWAILKSFDFGKSLF